jgi:type III pantothenate kinase
MNLTVDIGNTQFKVCIFNNDNLIFHLYLKNLTQGTAAQLISEYNIKNVIFSDTRGVNKQDFFKLFPKNLKILELTHQIPLPLQIDYQTPETLGKDRIASAVYAADKFAGLNCLVIDIGTAVTIDYITSDGIFKGGIISPGPEIRYRALHDYTGKLPLLEPVEDVKNTGNSTTQAIQSGVQNGILYEINGYISRFIKENSNNKIIITGGYAFLFEKKIKYPIFVNSFVVPQGLNKILIYNTGK